MSVSSKVAALAAIALAATAFAAPALAQDVAEESVTVGAIVDPNNAGQAVDPRDKSVAEIAVVYEDDTDASEPSAETK